MCRLVFGLMRLHLWHLWLFWRPRRLSTNLKAYEHALLSDLAESLGPHANSCSASGCAPRHTQRTGSPLQAAHTWVASALWPFASQLWTVACEEEALFVVKPPGFFLLYITRTHGVSKRGALSAISAHSGDAWAISPLSTCLQWGRPSASSSKSVRT